MTVYLYRVAHKSLGTRRNMLDIECHMTFAPPGVVWIALDFRVTILVMQCMFCGFLPSPFFLSFFVCFFLSCSDFFQPTLCRCSRLLLHLITHSHTQPIAETSVLRHTMLTRDRQPSLRQDSNSRSQQASGRSPTP